jgi:hypothetical protein
MYYKRHKKSMKKRNKLYKSWIENRTEDAKAKHRSYRNTLTHIIRCSKNIDYLNRFTDVKDDMRKTWKLINNVIADNLNTIVNLTIKKLTVS